MRRIVKPVPIALDRERSLVFDLNAVAAFEEATGKSPFEMLIPFLDLPRAEGESLSPEQVSGLLSKIKLSGVRALLWAALLHEDEHLTQKQVGSWLSLGDVMRIVPTLASAMFSSQPEPDPTTAAEAKAAETPDQNS